MLKSEEKQQYATNVPIVTNIVQPAEEKAIVGIDVTAGVNKAPYTGRKAPNTFALIIANENYDMAENVKMATNDIRINRETNTVLPRCYLWKNA